MNLDELEAKALAVKNVPGLGGYTGWYDLGGLMDGLMNHEDYEFIVACDPDTVLHLTERARAGEELLSYADHKPHCAIRSASDFIAEGGCSCGFAHWESLAHSPQEAAS